MTKRMTAEEVAAQFKAMGASAGGAWNHAAQIVRDNLVPQWQDEPTEGPCWVHGVDYACNVYHWQDDEQPGDGGWSIEYIKTRDDGTSEMRWEPLNGRQVCPIGARPQ